MPRRLFAFGAIAMLLIGAFGVMLMTGDNYSPFGLRDRDMRSFISGLDQSALNISIINPDNLTIDVYERGFQTWQGFEFYETWEKVATISGSGNLSLTPGLYRFDVSDPNYTPRSWESFIPTDGKLGDERIWVYPGGLTFIDFGGYAETTTTAEAEQESTDFWNTPVRDWLSSNFMVVIE